MKSSHVRRPPVRLSLEISDTARQPQVAETEVQPSFRDILERNETGNQTFLRHLLKRNMKLREKITGRTGIRDPLILSSDDESNCWTDREKVSRNIIVMMRQNGYLASAISFDDSVVTDDIKELVKLGSDSKTPLPRDYKISEKSKLIGPYRKLRDKIRHAITAKRYLKDCRKKKRRLIEQRRKEVQGRRASMATDGYVIDFSGDK
jgi:hypothetical protein